MIDDDKFNKYFALFIMIGMSVAVCIATAYGLKNSTEGRLLLLLSAFGSLMGVVGTVTSATGQMVTFFFSFFDVSIYGIACIINWKSGNGGLGNGLLHLFYFVPMQFIGFHEWKKREGSKGHVTPRRFKKGMWPLAITVFLLMDVAVYLLLAQFDRSAATSFLKMAIVVDTLPVVCNVIGQFLMSAAYMEQWIFWIGVNIFSIILWTNSYRQSADSFTLVYIIKYCFYLLNCCNGLRIWLRLSDPERAVLQNREK